MNRLHHGGHAANEPLRTHILFEPWGFPIFFWLPLLFP